MPPCPDLSDGVVRSGWYTACCTFSREGIALFHFLPHTPYNTAAHDDGRKNQNSNCSVKNEQKKPAIPMPTDHTPHTRTHKTTQLKPE